MAVEIDPAWQATFIPADPPRASWFALWNPDQPGAILVAGLKTAEVELVIPGGDGVARRTVTAARLPLRDAIDELGSLPATANVQRSVHAWAAVVRAGLGLIARGRMLPWVSPAGWDTWRVDPLDGADLANVEALGRSLPAFGHCTPVPDVPADTKSTGSPSRHSGVDDEGTTAAVGLRVSHPEHSIRACFDGLGDRLVRAPAAALLCESDVFAELQPTRVRHLRPWVTDVAGPLCRNAQLTLHAIPPESQSEAASLFDDADDDPTMPLWRLEFFLRSARDPSLVVPAARLWDAPAEVQRLLGGQVEVDLLTGLQRASEVCSIFRKALDHRNPTRMSLDDLDFDLFLDSLDDLQAAGIDVKWPADLVSADLERRLVVGEGTSAPGDAMPVVNDIDSLLKVNWEFLLEGTPLSSDELRVLSEAKRPVVPLRGRWVRLTASERQRLREPAPTLSSTDLLAAALGGGLDGSLVSGAATDDGSLFGRVATADEGELIDVRAVGRPAALIDRLLEIADGRLENEPEGLEATLRPYQRQGLAWMADLAAFGCGGCLADDMGLGKTIQLLALHQLRGAKTLVICPTSLMANWERETGRFLPAAAVRRYHGPNRSLDDLAPHQLVVTTYGVLRSDAEKLAAVGWDLCVADEAQYAKNPRSRTARALRKIPAASRIALTGTPVENRLTELWSIIDWVMPGLLGPLAAFRTNTAVPIERDDNQIVAKRLSNLLKPFVLRRVKTDPEIAPELPAKTESDVVVPLTAEQVSLYQATTSEALLDLAENDGMVRQGLILKLLTALKQITNHPAQYLGESEPLAGRSGKLDALDDLLDRAHANGESTLVFTQYVRMGQLLVDHLRARGVEVDLLHGGQSIANRQVLVDRMQSGDLPVLILSLKAGGTGLNLTRATQVIHYDRWWNPAVEDQATDRAYRIGQDKPVMVHRLVTEGTVEDRVAELLREKRRLADRVVGSGESWIGQLDNDELADLVQLADHDGHHEAGNEQTATPGSSM